MENKIVHNEANNCFEMNIDGLTAVVEYRMDGDRMVFPHTYVPTELEGQGIASALVKTALEYAKENNMEVVPLCSFVRAYVRRHPEYK